MPILVSATAAWRVARTVAAARARRRLSLPAGYAASARPGIDPARLRAFPQIVDSAQIDMGPGDHFRLLRYFLRLLEVSVAPAMSRVRRGDLARMNSARPGSSFFMQRLLGQFLRRFQVAGPPLLRQGSKFCPWAATNVASPGWP